MSTEENVQLGALRRSSRRWRKETKPIAEHAEPDEKPPQSEQSIAQRMPPEILLQIFNSIPRVRAKPSSYITGQIDPMRHIPRVCKAWFNPGTEVLYKFVCVPRVASAMLLHRTLSATNQPHSLLGFIKDLRRRSERKRSGLGSLIKILLLPKRVWVGCPARLMMLFARIVHLCESLEEIQVICNIVHDERFPHNLPRYPLPIPLGDHANLKSIALANAEGSLWTNFPLFSNQFPNLEEICLSGFRISTLVAPESIEPLMRLRSVRLESCDIGDLERWMMKCPCLRKLEIDLSVWVATAPDGGIFALDTLEELQWSRTSTPISLVHIGQNKRLETLTIDYHTFQKQWRHIPGSLKHLTLITREADAPLRTAFAVFFDNAEPVTLGNLESMTVRIGKDDPWMTAHADWLKALAKEKGVVVKLDLTRFGPLPVRPVATLWQDGAQTIRRLTRPVRAREIDWEQMYRQKM